MVALREDFQEHYDTALKDTYKKLQNTKMELDLEPFEAVKTVHELRMFWKPQKVNVVLLAESHVFTDLNEARIQGRYPSNPLLEGCPTSFVRFVYCFGYGESFLLTDKVKSNRGTPQFWKLFCAAASNSENFDFSKVLKSKTRDRTMRISNKLHVLEILRKKGVWLLDASIIALYHKGKKPKQKDYEKVLGICWEGYISHILKKERPSRLVVIGKHMARTLEGTIHSLFDSFDTIYQPQAKVSSEKHNYGYRLLQEVSNLRNPR